jgi:hypothetical protein
MNITKPNPNLSIRTNISVDMSANQWNLKTEEFPRNVIEKVASFLNKRVMFEYNKGESKEVALRGVMSLANHFEVYGATSKETKKVLDNLLDRVYN